MSTDKTPSKAATLDAFKDRMAEVEKQRGYHGDAWSPFQVRLADHYVRQLEDLYETLEDRPEDVDMERYLLLQADRCHANAYRSLAESITTSFGSSMGRVYREAEARAWASLGEDLRYLRVYGHFGFLNVEERP